MLARPSAVHHPRVPTDPTRSLWPPLGRPLHSIPKGEGLHPDLQTHEKTSTDTRGDLWLFLPSRPESGSPATIALCPATSPHQTQRWGGGRGGQGTAQGARNTCGHAWWLAVSASPRNLSSAVPELVCWPPASTAQHGPGQAPRKHHVGELGGGVPFSYTLRLVLKKKKKTRKKTDEPPSEGSDEG